jgi:hypothetical protein
MTELRGTRAIALGGAFAFLVLGLQVAGCSGESETVTKKSSDRPTDSVAPGGPGPDGKPVNRGSGR